MALNSRHVKLIARYSARYSVRGGTGLVFLLVSLTFGLIVAHNLMQPAEMMLSQAQRAGLEVSREEIINDLKDNQAVRGAVGWVLGGSRVEGIEDSQERFEAREAVESWIQFLLDERPAPLSAIFLILLWGWPFVVISGAFNLFSGDVQSRGLRYHLIRSERSSIFFGRTLGILLTQTLVVLILVIIIVVYMGARLPFYGWGTVFLWGMFGALALWILSLPFIALSAWISASIDSPFASLTVISLIVGGVPLLSLIGRNSWEPMEYVNYLLPWGVSHYLFHPSAVVAMGTALACFGYAALFLFLGHRHFLRRDL